MVGCTDPNATNYDPNAGLTDNSLCTYPCIASDTTESFELGLGAWANDTINDVDWTTNIGGTTSGSTGPTAAFDGVSYAYVETSFPAAAGDISQMSLACVDASAWTAPTLVFAYPCTVLQWVHFLLSLMERILCGLLQVIKETMD